MESNSAFLGYRMACSYSNPRSRWGSDAEDLVENVTQKLISIRAPDRGATNLAHKQVSIYAEFQPALP